MATVYRMVKETTPQGKQRWVRRRDSGPGTWFLAYCRDGKQIKEATDATSKTEAQMLLKTKLSNNVKAEILDVPAAGIDLTFAAFVDDTFLPHVKQTRRASTHVAYTGYAKTTKRALGELLLRRISRGHIKQYISDRVKNGRTWKETPLAPATINREVSFIRAAFNDALDRELVDHNPCARIELLHEENTRTRVMSVAEEKKLLGELEEWMHPILHIAVETGLRLGEIVALKWKSEAGAKDGYVDLERNVVHVSHESKNHKTRDIPISSALHATLSKLPRRIKDGVQISWVFTDPYSGEQLTDYAVGGYYRRAVRRAKIIDLTFHDLRRTFASRLAERDVSLQKISKLLGQSATYVTERYAHLSDDGLKDAVALLSESSKPRSRRARTS